MTIQKQAKAILKILYEYFKEHDPNKSLSAEHIFGRLEEEIPAINIDASLRYLTNKGYINESIHSKSKIEAYVITPEGIENYESAIHDNDVLKNTPIVSFKGNLNGTLIINNPHAKTNANNHNNTYNSEKEFIDHYDSILHLVNEVRKLPKKVSIPDEIKIDIREKCNDIEEIIQTSHWLNDDEQYNAVFGFLDFVREFPKKTSIPENIKNKLVNQCDAVESLVKHYN